MWEQMQMETQYRHEQIRRDWGSRGGRRWWSRLTTKFRRHDDSPAATGRRYGSLSGAVRSGSDIGPATLTGPVSGTTMAGFRGRLPAVPAVSAIDPRGAQRDGGGNRAA